MKFQVRATSQRQTTLVDYDPKGVRVPVPVNVELLAIDDEGGGRQVGGKVVAELAIPHAYLVALAGENGWELPAKPAAKPKPASKAKPKK